MKDGGVFQEGNEIFVAAPGVVKKNVFTKRSDFFQNFSDIVKKAVVGAYLQAGQTEGTLFFSKPGTDFPDFFPKVCFFQRGGKDGTDDAAVIAAGGKVYRQRSRFKQCSLPGGFMVVPVKKDQVSR